MVVILTTILFSENSSPFCQFLDGCYCTTRPLRHQILKGHLLNNNLMMKFGTEPTEYCGQYYRKRGFWKHIYLWYLLPSCLQKTARHFFSFLTDATVCSRTTKNPGVSIGPLAHPFVCSHHSLICLLQPARIACALGRSLTLSWAHETVKD